MQANIVDLRYKMKSIIKALERNETVTILYHGKEKGTIFPSSSGKEIRVVEHPFFGMVNKDKAETVESTMEALRGSRY